MAYSKYIHGAYGETIANSDKVSRQSRSAPIYVGTAPVHTVPGGKQNLHTPIVVSSFMEATKRFGYSEDWATYTLCEAMYAHFILGGIGPLILINCLDVDATTDADEPTAVSITPVNGRATISEAENIILDSVDVTGKELGVDYNIVYDPNTRRIVLSQTTVGSLGTAALSVTYKTVDASTVTADDIVGQTDDEGSNTGLYAVRDVYQKTGYIPALLLCPGFSSVPAVHAEMIAQCRKVNKHWDLFAYVDIPLLDGASRMALSGVAAWKATNGYTHENEKVFFPLVKGTDGRFYHLSVLACANKQVLDAQVNGVPYQSSSNTAVRIIQNLYFGDPDRVLCIDDATINEKLNEHGVASAAFIGGQWVIWGAHTAQYNQEDADEINVSETNLMMLYYISNDFQHRRATEIDKPMTANRLKQIVAEEQARLDALVSTGALLFGEVYLSATAQDRDEMRTGDFNFRYNVTTTPISKSMTALVSWTDEGFETYFAIGEGQ